MDRQGAKIAKNAKQRFYPEPSAEVDALARGTIGAAIAVHRELGPGFLEGIYEQAMTVELTTRGLPFSRQVVVPVFYGEYCVGEPRLDLLVGNRLVVELKAVEELRSLHFAQVRSYLRAGPFELGLLINFNVMQLVQGVKRVVSTL